MPGSILVPLDGTALSRKAVKQAARLARQSGSKLVLFHAAPDCRSFFTEAFVPPAQLPGLRKKEIELMESKGHAVLAAAAKSTGLARRQVEQQVVMSESPYEAIIAAARKNRCKLIVMASRGRGAVSGLFLGSETRKVLANSKVPVLVVR